MPVNIIQEVKQLHVSMCRFIFDVNQHNILTKHPSPLQIGIAHYLLERPNEVVYQKDIQKALHVSKAAISDAIASMQKKHLIEKIPSNQDGRSNQIILLEDGIEIFEEIQNDMASLNQKILTSITEEELNEFLRVSRKIQECLKKEDEM